MDKSRLEIKLAFITGLREVVFSEIAKHPNLRIDRKGIDSFYLGFVSDFNGIKKMKSVSRAYLVKQDVKYNPLYISSHKSVIDNLVDMVVREDNFKTFKLTCAGKESPEARDIAKYVCEKYKLTEKERTQI